MFTNAWHIGTFFKIPVKIHWTFLLIIAYVIGYGISEGATVMIIAVAITSVLSLFLCVLLHEFGHALHGLCSNVKYPSLSGTNVATDYVEFPSQILERWLSTKEILQKFALHY